MLKNPPANAREVRDTDSVSGLVRSPGGGNGYPLQYSHLENTMDRGAWWATVHGSHRVDVTERTKHARRAGKELWGKTQVPGKRTGERAISDSDFRGGFFLDVVFQQRRE